MLFRTWLFDYSVVEAGIFRECEVNCMAADHNLLKRLNMSLPTLRTSNAHSIPVSGNQMVSYDSVC